MPGQRHIHDRINIPLKNTSGGLPSKVKVQSVEEVAGRGDWVLGVVMRRRGRLAEGETETESGWDPWRGI